MVASPLDRFRTRVFEYRWLLAVLVVIGLFVGLRPAADAAGGVIANLIGSLVGWIIRLPWLRQFPGFYYMRIDWSEFATLFGNHLALTAECVGAAVLVSLPLGLLLHRVRRLYLPSFAILDAIYAIPSLSIFPVLLKTPGFGVSDATVIVVIVAYAQFIMVRNVHAGLSTVTPEVKESARGMGLSRLQILMQIEFPLALPVIVAGIRITTIAAIGIASIGALTGIEDLGHFLFSARNGGGNAVAEVDAGVVGVVALALGSDLIFRAIERFIPANRVARAEN